MKPLSYHSTTLLAATLMITLCQSCVIYQNKPSTLEEAANPKFKTKITTVDGEKYKFNWLTIEDENIRSIQKTNKQSLKISDVEFVLDRTDSVVYKTDSIVHIKGDLFLKQKQRNEYLNFCEIYRYNDLIVGIKSTGRDTLTVIIPKEDIAKIQIQNKGYSGAGTSFIILASFSAIVGAVILYMNGIGWY